MIAGSMSSERWAAENDSGIIPVFVAPPGSSVLSVIPVPASSYAQIVLMESRAALDGP